MEISCAQCRYFSRSDSTCRVHPPVKLWDPDQAPNDSDEVNRGATDLWLWAWPRVLPTDWCGHFMKDEP